MLDLQEKTMYKIILAEDEPGAAQNIRDILKFYCPDFDLIAEAESGVDCLALIMEHMPDLLLADIRMPKMDGLELISRLRKELPDMITIIISGYQDFEYARTAMRNGASDYILKPVAPRTLQTALDRIKPLLDGNKNQEQASLLRQLINHRQTDTIKLLKYFNAPAYTIAISRKNGLPGRFSRNAYNFKFTINAGCIDICGRDEMECIHLCSDNSIKSVEIFNKINWLHKEIPGYTTTVIWSDSFPILKLPDIIKSLYFILDTSLAIEVTQVISANSPGSKKGDPENEIYRIGENYIRELKPGETYKFLLDYLEKCRLGKYPQLYLEKTLRFFFDKVQTFPNFSICDDDTELMIDDAFYYATNYDELKESLFDILRKLLKEQNSSFEKVDSPEFFNLIRDYILGHLSEKLTLQSMCKYFGISQTYLSRLFRKYTGLSFINYLTETRIEKAKKILEKKDNLVRDAAAMVGFTDQYYFSRVFRTLTGQAPSRYE